MVEQFAEQSVILVDSNFKAKDGNPANMKVCKRGEWNDRMIVESVLSMLTVVCHFKKVGHRVWSYFPARLAYTMAAFNVLVDWFGLYPDDNGFVHLSIAEFSL
jgi:hypothetical protein